MEIPRTSLAELEALSLTDENGKPLVQSEPLWPGREVPVAPIVFGQTVFDDQRMVEHPFQGAWRRTEYSSVPVRLYRLRNACVHSSAGVVMVANRLVSESLDHVFPAEYGLDVDPETGTVRLFAQTIQRLPGRAVHALAAGAYNYYHWMIEVLCRLAPLPESFYNDLFLVPPLDQSFQMDSLSRLGRPIRAHAIKNGEMLLVDELIMIPSFTGFGYYPPPNMLSMCDRLIANIEIGSRFRRIYVHRLKSGKRRLSNETAVISMLEKHGYEILDLDTLSFERQVRCFAEATHVISPHGAGLTNLIFCRPDTAVFELQMDCYTNWLFRRLASIRSLRYGCIIGEIDGDWEPEWPHNRSWTVPLPRLADELSQSGFV